MTESLTEENNSLDTMDNITLIKNVIIEIENKNFDKAISLTENGINKFPKYPTLLLLHAKALLGKSRNIEAEEIIRTTTEMLNCEDTLEYYLNLIPSAEQEIEHMNENEEKDFNIQELAVELSNAKLDILHDHDETEISVSYNKPITPGRSLVSETLARIYFSQENYKEAKEIYETLIEIQPEREDYYKSKLLEINQKMGISS